MTQAPANSSVRPASAPAPAPGMLRGLLRRFHRAITDPGNPAVITQPLAGNDANRYLDPATLARFGLTPLLARMVVEGFISGLHRSPFHGFSVEFADHREYVPGDDLKYLDWMLFARTDHYYIKRYEEETNVRCYLLMDSSQSMAFGTNGMTKWDYACFLASCLSYLMLKQQDAVGLALLRAQAGMLVPPRCRGSHLQQIMRSLIQNPPSGQTDLDAGMRGMVRNLKRRSLIVVMSDLIDDPQRTLRALRLLRSRKHDVIVFHIQDPAELEFTFDGSTLFRDVETGEELEVDPASVRQSYLDQVSALQTFYRKGLTEFGIDYVNVDTRKPYDHALWAYLQARGRLAK